MYYYTLPNGLRIVPSHDHTAPTAAVAVYYAVGFRTEPRNRRGFGHLFEHLMFQGSQNLGKNAFIGLIQKNGGARNDSMRFYFTNYNEVVPAHKLETARRGQSVALEILRQYSQCPAAAQARPDGAAPGTGAALQPRR